MSCSSWPPRKKMRPNLSNEKIPPAGRVRPRMSNDRPPMPRWPSLRKVITVWAVLSAIAYVSYVSYWHSLPPDELVMANDLGFQATVGLIVVGLPALFFLLFALLVGAIAKRWLIRESSDGSSPSPMSDVDHGSGAV